MTSQQWREPGWLHEHLHRIFVFIAGTYYQVRVVGAKVPVQGPVLLVSNHPNSLLDPALMAMAAGRPIRYLAGAHLFRRRVMGWVVRGAGAIPVFRREEEPNEMGRNQEAFRAVEQALLDGSAVGVFPEGFTHSGPHLAPLKTGAARMALQTAAAGGSFPIIPLGITYRGGKERFRSEAILWVGQPVRWADLAANPEDPSHIRMLTQRIEAALGRLTVNLRDWDDLPLVELAEAIHEAEIRRDRNPNPVRWLARMRRTARAMDQLRLETEHTPEWNRLAESLRDHGRILQILGLSPRDLHERPKSRVAFRWTLVNLLFFGVTLPLAAMGSLIFWAPWTLVTKVEPRFQLPLDRQATYRVLATVVAGGGWVLILATLALEFQGWRSAMSVLLLFPLLGLLTLRIRTRWRAAVRDLRRFLFLRGQDSVRTELLETQRRLAKTIRALQLRL